MSFTALPLRLIFAVVAALAIGAAVAVLMLLRDPLPQAARPIVIRFSHVVANDTPKGKGALRFKQLAEAATSGAVRVEVYPNSTLYKDKEELEALQLGAVQMLAPSLSKFGLLGLREFEVFDLPYLFDGYAELRRVTDGPVGKELLARLEAKGIIGLAYWDNGFKVMSANRPLRRPHDFRGLRMRIQPSTVLDAQMRALGAIPHKMAFSEVRRALETGVVDGTENPPSNLYTQGMHDVQPYVTLSHHGYLGYAVIVQEKFWDALPWRIRRRLEEAMDEATRYANAIAKQENDAALEAVRASGKARLVTLTEAEKREWKRALIAVHKQMEARIGADIIQEIYRTTGFDPEGL